MSMYTIRVVDDRNCDYIKLIPGGEYRRALNLSQPGPICVMNSWSIQAMASANVAVKCWISSFIHMPFNDKTENKGWKSPTPNADVGDLWLPCTSIADFTVSPGTNYFAQGEWNDIAQFLMFQLSPSFPVDSKKLTDSQGIPVDEIAFSLAITFR